MCKFFLNVKPSPVCHLILLKEANKNQGKQKMIKAFDKVFIVPFDSTSSLAILSHFLKCRCKIKFSSKLLHNQHHFHWTWVIVCLEQAIILRLTTESAVLILCCLTSGVIIYTRIEGRPSGFIVTLGFNIHSMLGKPLWKVKCSRKLTPTASYLPKSFDSCQKKHIFHPLADCTST